MLIIEILIIMAGFSLLYPRLRRYYLLKSWAKAYHIKKHEQHFRQLFAQVDGFQLSHQARLQQDSIEYTYGEIRFKPFIALMSNIGLSQNSVFYDLGSGTGKAVLACAMVFDIKKSIGIEILSDLYQAASQQQKKLNEIPCYKHLIKQINFYNDDFLQYDYQDATHIFINATAFFADRWQQISEHLECLAKGTMAVTTSKPLKSAYFVCEKMVWVSMSWGPVQAYIQRKI